MIVDIVQNPDHVAVSYINDKHSVSIAKLSLPPEGYANWAITDEYDSEKDPVFRNYAGQPVKRVRDRKFYDLNVHEFLSKRIPVEDQERIHAYNKLNFFSVDIEVEVKDEFPVPEKAHLYQIYSFSVTAPTLGTIVFSTKQCDETKVQKIVDDWMSEIDPNRLSFVKQQLVFPVKHFFFESEIQMIEFFLSKINEIFHLHGGWHYDFFDWPFIKNRCTHLGIDIGRLASPDGQLDRNGIPVHRLIVDYEGLYKQYSRKGYMISYSLDYVSWVEFGAKKLSYDGTLKELYTKDYDRFIAYAAIDTILVQLIHMKNNSIDSFMNMAYYNKISIKKAMSPIAQTDALIFEEFYSKGLVYADPPRDIIREDYPGAFVKQPVRKVANYPTGYDAKALYPSTGRTFNISPELYMGKCKPEQVKDLQSKGFVVTELLSVYDQSKGSGIFKSLWEKLGNERAVYKNCEMDIWENLMKRVEDEAERRSLKLK